MKIVSLPAIGLGRDRWSRTGYGAAIFGTPPAGLAFPRVGRHLVRGAVASGTARRQTRAGPPALAAPDARPRRRSIKPLRLVRLVAVAKTPEVHIICYGHRLGAYLQMKRVAISSSKLWIGEDARRCAHSRPPDAFAGCASARRSSSRVQGPDPGCPGWRPAARWGTTDGRAGSSMVKWGSFSYIFGNGSMAQRCRYWRKWLSPVFPPNFPSRCAAPCWRLHRRDTQGLSPFQRCAGRCSLSPNYLLQR